jgi:RNA polymerase sigma factor (sigma-70 family)
MARLATLDAYTSFSEEGGRSLSSWVYKHIFWRLTLYVRQEPIFEPFDGPVLNGKNPEEKFFTEERRMWLESAIGMLSPRQRTIVCAQLSGESIREIAPTLGISVARVGQEAKAALEQLKALRQDPEK